jgi:ABC-2 type transport system ATP-binding protein
MSYAVEIENLTKVFNKNIVAVDNLDLHVKRGSVYGLIGRNGAGKTTTLRILAGLIRPDQGIAKILGHDMLTSDHATRALMTYVSQQQQLHTWMTIEQHCEYLSHFYPHWDQEYAKRLQERFVLAWNEQTIGELSGGQQRKAAVLLAFAARPDVILLDEPAAGLDPISRRELISEIIEIITSEKECTVILSTHIMSDLERVADTIGVIDRGRLKFSMSVDELKSQIKRVQVIFETAEIASDFQVPGAISQQIDGPVVNAIVKVVSDSQLDSLKNQSGVRVLEHHLNLEECVIALMENEVSA